MTRFVRLPPRAILTETRIKQRKIGKAQAAVKTVAVSTREPSRANERESARLIHGLRVSRRATTKTRNGSSKPPIGNNRTSYGEIPRTADSVAIIDERDE